MTADVTHEPVVIAEHLRAVDEREAAERAAAISLQGEQAYTYWAQAGSSPIGRAGSRERLAYATLYDVDPLVIVVNWLAKVAERGRRQLLKEAARATR